MKLLFEKINYNEFNEEINKIQKQIQVWRMQNYYKVFTSKNGDEFYSKFKIFLRGYESEFFQDSNYEYYVYIDNLRLLIMEIYFAKALDSKISHIELIL